MRELSIFVDESGEPGDESKYYLLTLVFHDQDDSIGEILASYERTIADKGLPDIPLHASPLMNGHDEYQGMALGDRKRLLSSFMALLRRLPLRYCTLSYRKSEFSGADELFGRIRRDMVNLLFDNLDYFQSFDRVKIYYDDGQPQVTAALHGAVGYALAKDATLYRWAQPADYRLAQAADLLCTLELTATKFERHEGTSTDEKVFGSPGAFRREYLRKVRDKAIPR